ncbi:hypothetical protein F2Q69_00047123 [Brassica cretica]|uniref:Uncharacterized protein n=1 Tax=Brassica cretica TaxID=69181 RepID=A0A8S9PX65_BRACR|nr:hypothetical protein F2Q69_00047123 [Brassica cretica]
MIMLLLRYCPLSEFLQKLGEGFPANFKRSRKPRIARRTVQTCDDDDLDVHGSNADENTLIIIRWQQGTRLYLLHEDGIIARMK